MENNLLKAVFFDLDDTLYAEEDFVRSGFKSVARYMEDSYGIDAEQFLRSLLKILKNDGRGKVFDVALTEYDLYKKSLVNKLVNIYRSHTPKIHLHSGVKNLLRQLKRKYKLALITDGLGSVQRKKIHCLNLESFFDLIICTDDLGKRKGKPHTHSFKRALNFFNINPQAVVYVGDDPNKDFVGAKKIGIKTIRVLQGRFKNIKSKKKFMADFNVLRTTDIIKCIRDF